MVSLLRLAALAALALALVPAAAHADTADVVFPVAGPVLRWHDDYGTLTAGARQLGNSIGVAAGTPVVASAAGRVRMLWRGGGGWSITLTMATGDQFIYLHLGRDGTSACCTSRTAGHPSNPTSCWPVPTACPLLRDRRRRSRGSCACTEC
jgi:hypothetical protein